MTTPLRPTLAPNGQPHDHNSHSRLVKAFRVPSARNPFGLEWTETESHTLRSPFPGYLVEVSFGLYAGHPDYVRIRSSNWRAEDEPSGVFAIADARRFYKLLSDAGFREEL